MDLRTALKGLSPSELSPVAKFWNVMPDDDVKGERNVSRSLMEHLYPRMQSAQCFRAAFEKLAPELREVTWVLAVHGGKLPEQELADRCFRGDRVSLRRTAEQLRKHGFVWPDEIQDGDETVPMLRLPDCYLKFLELPPHLKGYLGAMLLSYPPAQIRRIAAALPGLGRVNGSNEAQLYRVREHLLKPETLKAYIETIPVQEQEIFWQIARRKGSCLYRELLDSDAQKRFDHKKAEFVNALVNTRGLVFTLIHDENKYNNLLVIPRDLFQIVSSGFASDCRSFEQMGLASGTGLHRPGVIVDNSHCLLRDMVIVASLFQSHEIKRLANGGVNRNDLRRVVPLLRGRNPLNYALFLTSFLIAKKFLIDINGFWTLSDSFERWLSRPDPCYWDVYTWWLLESDWNESASEGWSGENDNAHLRANLLTARGVVLQALSGLISDQWISFSAFAESIAPQLGVATKAKSKQKAGTVTPLLRGVIAESLNWLGIVSIGLEGGGFAEMVSRKDARNSGDDEDFQFLPTPLGASILRRQAMHPNELARETVGFDGIVPDHVVPTFIMQPNLEIIAPPDLRLEKLLMLTRFCELRSVDVMTIFEVTRESMRAGLDSGLTGPGIVEFITTGSPVQVPETFFHLVEECTMRYGETRICAAGGYVQADDPMVIQELRANVKFAPLIKEVVDDKTILLVPDTDLTKLAREMRTMGFMPQLESDTVQATTDDKYHVVLSSEELLDLIAAARLVSTIEEHLHVDISHSRAGALAQKLRTDTSGLHRIAQQSDAAIRTYEKRFKAAYDKTFEDISEKYKTQVSRLVTRSMSTRGPTKYQFRGPNPAIEQTDILTLLSFATDYEIETEITYVKQNQQESRIMIMPRSFEGERLYAHCLQTDSDSIYSLERILQAKLI